MLATLGVIGASPASASMGGCTGPVHGWVQQDICVTIETGTKDPVNHRQWISWVEGHENHPAPNELLEIWGDGFYYNSYGFALHKDINKWVASGTNICAAETDHWGVREIACMHISA
jgi:hypothetical protein